MRRAWAPLGLAVALVAAGLVVRELPSGADGLLLRTSGAGVVAFLAAATMLCAVGMPRQVAAYVGAFAFGLWGGGALALLAQVAGCALDVWWARRIGRDWARGQMRRRLGGRLARLDGFLSAQPFTATLTLRLLPVGNNLVLNLLAGVSAIGAGRFLLASAIGYIPQTAIFALLGSGTRIDHATQLAVAATLFAASACGGAVLLRRVRGVVA